MPPRPQLVVALVLAAAVCAPPARAQDVEGGRAIYAAKCAKCHGKTGVPRRIAKGAPNFTDARWSIPLAQVERSVVEGKGEEMPTFKTKLAPEQIKSVSAYVLTLKHGAPAPGDAQPGDVSKE
jgi:cytochrome c oxidase cbb3-type subunit 3